MTYVSQFQTTLRSQLKNKRPNKRREEEHQNLHYFKPKDDGFFPFFNVMLKISKPFPTCLLNDAFCEFLSCVTKSLIRFSSEASTSHQFMFPFPSFMGNSHLDSRFLPISKAKQLND